MAISRKFLAGMGLTEEQISSIIEMHTETVDSWKAKNAALQDDVEKYKADIDKYKESAEKLPNVQLELDKLKAEAEKGNPFEEKYNKLKKQFDDFKTETETKEHKAAVDKAVKAYFEEKNIKGANLDIALRAASGEISAVELEDGKIKDTKTLDELVGGTLSGLVSKTGVRGANVPNPPGNTGGTTTKTKDDIMKIKNTAERQKAIAENPELFGLN